MGGAEIDQAGLGSRIWHVKKGEKKMSKKNKHTLWMSTTQQNMQKKHNCTSLKRTNKCYSSVFFWSSFLWIPDDSCWQSLIIAGLSLITSQNARLPCQRKAFRPAVTAVSMECHRHTSEHEWCEESCQIRLSGFPPIPPQPARLHVHGWGHRSRPPESSLYCWGLTD